MGIPKNRMGARMITLTATTRCFVCIEPQDFRKGIDGMAGLVRNKLFDDPMSGALYLFCNRKKTSIKILCHDGGGYWICTKRLSVGSFKSWPTKKDAMGQALNMTAREIQVLLWNGNPKQAAFCEDWRKIM